MTTQELYPIREPWFPKVRREQRWGEIFRVNTEEITRIHLTDGRWWDVLSLEITTTELVNGDVSYTFEARVRDQDEEGEIARRLVGHPDQILLAEAEYTDW